MKAQDLTLCNLKSIFQEVSELYSEITQSGVQVDVDAPKGQDLTKIMEEMRANYEKITLKNQEELKAWHESKVGHILYCFSKFTLNFCFKDKKKCEFSIFLYRSLWCRFK